MEKLKQLEALVESVKDDAEKFYVKENGLAGSRVRKSMQDIKNLAQEIRLEVSEIKNKKGGETVVPVEEAKVA
jgi:hypothetical protein